MDLKSTSGEVFDGIVRGSKDLVFFRGKPSQLPPPSSPAWYAGAANFIQHKKEPAAHPPPPPTPTPHRARQNQYRIITLLVLSRPLFPLYPPTTTLGGRGEGIHWVEMHI
jgi:hypothetical protein